jgi:osmoprotectant transport system permease protein
MALKNQERGFVSKLLSGNRVLLFASLLGMVSVLIFDFLVFRENRLAAGEGRSLVQAGYTGYFLIFLFFWGMALIWSYVEEKKKILFCLTHLFVAFLFFTIGTASGGVLEGLANQARVSPGGSFWVQLIASLILLIQFYKKMNLSRWMRAGFPLLLLGVIVFLFAGGTLDSLSIVREFENNQGRFLSEVRTHISLSVFSVVIAMVLGIPLGLGAYWKARIEKPVFGALNVIQTVPSLVLFALLMIPLSYLSTQIPLFRQLGIQGIGYAPALIALFLYVLLPITRNTFAGFKSIPTGVLESGRGMGMTGFQLLWMVQLPLVLPVILNGIRIALIQAIGNTAVAALIGAGGLGTFIFQGLGQAAMDLILLGALPTIFLAVAADFGMQALIYAIRPEGLK